MNEVELLILETCGDFKSKVSRLGPSVQLQTPTPEGGTSSAIYQPSLSVEAVPDILISDKTLKIRKTGIYWQVGQVAASVFGWFFFFCFFKKAILFVFQ